MKRYITFISLSMVILSLKTKKIQESKKKKISTPKKFDSITTSDKYLDVVMCTLDLERYTGGAVSW